MLRIFILALLSSVISHQAFSQDKPRFILLPRTYQGMTPQQTYDYIKMSPELAERFYASDFKRPNRVLLGIDHNSDLAQYPLFRKGIEALAKNDKCEAAKLFQDAAIGGHRSAQYALAHAAYIGAGIPQDLSLAKAWFSNALKPDDRSSPRPLAWIYFHESGLLANVSDQPEQHPSMLDQPIICLGA